MRAWVTDTNRESRPNDWDFRFNVSMQGSLSVGGNLLKYSEEELEIHKKYIALYKEIRDTVQFGALYRLGNFRQDSIYANEYVYGNQCVLFLCTNVNLFFNERFYNIRLEGLEENGCYRFRYNGEEKIFSGAYLMNVGLEFDMWGTLRSDIIVFEKAD